jgi:hypothetical protein
MCSLCIKSPFHSTCVIIRFLTTSRTRDADTEFQKTVLSKLEQLERNQKNFEKQLDLVAAYNPWATRTKSKQSRKDALLKALRHVCGMPETCLLSRVVEDKDQQIYVSAAHLWPSCNPDKFKEFEQNTGEKICETIDDASNGMLLLSDIEQAYDSQKIVFLCQPFDVSLRLLVLDPGLKDVCPKGCTKKFRELEQCVIGKPTIH